MILERTKDETLEYANKRKIICSELKQMIVEQLCLEIDPNFITDDQPLFGRGLELDSVDALELATGIYDKYMITLSDGDTTVFSSVNTMADCVLKNLEADSEIESDIIGEFIDIQD